VTGVPRRRKDVTPRQPLSYLVVPGRAGLTVFVPARRARGLRPVPTVWHATLRSGLPQQRFGADGTGRHEGWVKGPRNRRGGGRRESTSRP